MFYYAQIDPVTRACFAVSSLADEVVDPDLIELQSENSALIGKRWTGTAWEQWDGVAWVPWP